MTLDDILLRSAIEQACDAQKGIRKTSQYHKPNQIKMLEKRGILFHKLGGGKLEIYGLTEAAKKEFLDDKGGIRAYYRLPSATSGSK